MQSNIRLTFALCITAPLLLAHMGLLMFCLGNWWSYHSPVVWIWVVVVWPLLLAYYYLWTPIGMIYLLLCLLANLWAWRERGFARMPRVLLISGLVVTLLGVVYDIWWYVTGQIWGPIT